jgi:hypothetical protein
MEAQQKMKQWLEDIIIGLNLCPFAKTPYENGLIRLTSSDQTELEDVLNDFVAEIAKIHSEGPSEISNTLLYYPKLSVSFEEFLDIYASCNLILEEIQATQLYQIVVFHPEFLFDGINEDKRDHFVNRSPYPMLHLLRKEELNQVMTHDEMGEQISLANSQKLNQLSEAEFKALFEFARPE